MRILLTGVCGFVGSVLAAKLREAIPGAVIIGLDNLVRPGSEVNRRRLRETGLRVVHGDIRLPSDLEGLPSCDWILDAAANPSVLAGVDGKTGARQLVEHNLVGTLNLLELARRWNAGFILLGTSRVYSIAALCALPLVGGPTRFIPDPTASVTGLTPEGITEDFSTSPPLSLYGSAKLASEVMALEYGAAFGFPVFVNRCGVMAGAEQFGKADQGIVSFWIRSYAARRPLRYIGFDGSGRQVRDCLHPADLAPLLIKQMRAGQSATVPRVVNVGGGAASAFSLAELSAWCADRFGAHPVLADLTPRPFDLGWLVLDATRAQIGYDWHPTYTREAIFSEIAEHALQHPEWLGLSED
ncbi:NAD-dependent epimerase/dehydratase family protein [Chloracidobacterium validum]|uniref:NAD-dependent epimerase/dehydratase family protein n=1 Tax=Chloracidobacterium validum TaxID=2821543 RepID=A0ABX8BCA2_9BACT|nr:NAD-dependent epimerase/dehydratase family protein [Chloracidobacterium validum]QUW04306.1 NAD-dependent epimerase/dehydratase family protein [Chloracidobacterium validum]